MREAGATYNDNEVKVALVVLAARLLESSRREGIRRRPKSVASCLTYPILTVVWWNV